MVSFTSAAVMALLAAPALAAKVQQHIQEGPAIYKKVRSLVYMGMEQDRDLRGGNSSSTLRCFYECVAQDMDSTQCIQYIQDTIGAELDEHEIPNLQIKVSAPRTPQSISETYWMIGIPTNIYGEVDCNINGGVISYIWDWETSEGVSPPIPPVECAGMAADSCCRKVLKDISAAGIPLTDINGNCLSCWVHQEPLEPVIAADTGSLSYLEHAQGDEGACEATELTPAAVQAVDDGVETQLVAVRATIDDILTGAWNCGDFMELHGSLMYYGRAFPAAMSKISGLLCGVCSYAGDDYELTSELISKLNFIKDNLSGEINSDENCIIIYTDHQDKVLEPPKIGGSRNELDWDRDDPDCNDDGPDPGPIERSDCIYPKILGPGFSCVCPEPFADDNQEGCNACADGVSRPETNCLYAPVSCNGRNQVDNGKGACVCIPGFKDLLGRCIIDCSAVRNTVSSARGNCICIDGYERDEDVGPCWPIGGGPGGAPPRDCPAGSYEEYGVCYVPCTADDVANDVGSCGNPFTLCLTQQCGEDWSDDCREVVRKERPISFIADAWADCLATGNLSSSIDDFLAADKSKKDKSLKKRTRNLLRDLQNSNIVSANVPQTIAINELVEQCATRCAFVGRLAVDESGDVMENQP